MKLEKLKEHYKDLEREELRGFIEDRLFEGIYDRDKVILKANLRIIELCKMVTVISGDTKKVRPEDWIINIKEQTMKTKDIDWEEYESRVSELEAEGITRSDAQSIIDIEMGI